VSNVKGRMMMTSIGSTIRVIAVLGLLEFLWLFLFGGDLSFILGPVVRVLLAGLFAQGAVLAGWNVVAACHSASDEITRRDAVLLPIRTYQEGLEAIGQAMTAGTLSMNGVRYPGPLPAAPSSDALLWEEQALVMERTSCAACGRVMAVKGHVPGRMYFCRAHDWMEELP
jgi:hypothetical protein